MTDMAEVDRLAASSYVLLTTFRKDGTPVATPVWVSRDGEHLFAWTQADSGKVKRIRNGGRVLVGPCDQRGGLQGTEVEGTARVLDSAADLARVAGLHRAKYGVQFRLFDLGAKIFRRNRPQVAIEISVG